MLRFHVLLIAAALSVAARPPDSKSRLAPARLQQIPARMKAFVEDGNMAGAMTLIQRHGFLAGVEAVGWQDIEARKPMRPG